MIARSCCAALAAILLLVAPVLADPTSPAQGEAPKLTARPQGLLSGDLKLTALDEKAAYAFSQSAIGRPLGDFVLLDRDGRPVELARYRGKPLLINFIYTACFQVCPTTTRNLQKALENTVSVMGADRFNVVSIGFNQPFDSPAALRDFARQYGIDLPNWNFLSPAAAIVDPLTAHFGFRFIATAAGFDHLNQVTLIDAEGIIVRQVYGEKFTAEDIAEPLKRLIAGSAIPPERGTLQEIMERVRILCSVYDPRTGRYRTDYSLYFMFAGFVTFAGFMIYLSINFWRNRRRNTPRAS